MEKFNKRKINVVIVKDLSDKQRIQDKEIRNDAFSYLSNLSKSDREDLHDKYKINPWKYLFAIINGEYLGRVVLDKRDIKLKDKLVIGVGIGGLSVRKDNQKQGIGKTLVRSSIDLCKKESIDFVFLNAGDELQSYYKSFGFREKAYKFTGISGRKYTENEGMILILNKNLEKELLSYEIDVGVGNV